MGSAIVVASFVLATAPAFAGTTACTGGGGGVLMADPIDQICRITSGYVDQGKSLATNLLIALLVIEFFFLGIRHALFKNDLSELFGSITYKVFMAGLMLAVIANADTLFQGVVRGFEGVGQDLSGTTSGTADTVASSYTVTALLLVTSIESMHTGDYLENQIPYVGGNSTIAPGIPPFIGLGNGPILTGNAMAIAHQHELELNLLYLLAMVFYGCAATVLISYVLFTAESYIVIFGGIIFLGFAGTSFTQQFSSGYMKYAINSGARLMMFYIVLGIEQAVLPNVLGQATVAAATSFFGTASVAVADAQILVIAIATLQVVVLTSLVYAVPTLVAGVLSGQSGSSAAALLQTVSSSATMMSNSIKHLNSAFKGGSGGES